jgi:molybdenum cofactor synthesis domain-containing protein
MLAGTRVIPLTIPKEKLHAAQQFSGNRPLLAVLPYKGLKTGIVTTGNEVFYGRIEDTFSPVIRAKLAAYGAEAMAHRIVSDDPEATRDAIEAMIAQGAEMVICTGGMSVDADDRTPLAIKLTGASMVTYGAPVLPGSMFLMAYTSNGIPIMGLPGCVMYSKRTIFDLVLPRVLAGIPITKAWIAGLGNGGLCLDCDVCTYPNCGFGK